MLRSIILPLVALSVLSAVGCAPPTDNFVGAWSGNGTFTVTAHSTQQTSTSQLASDSVQILDGATSDIVISWNQCAIPATVEGDIASVQSGFVCTLTQGAATFQLSFTTGTLTRVQNTLTFATSGAVTMTQEGASGTGSFNVQESLTKLGK